MVLASTASSDKEFHHWIKCYLMNSSINQSSPQLQQKPWIWIKFFNHIHVFFPQQWSLIPKQGEHIKWVYGEILEILVIQELCLARVFSAWKGLLGKTLGWLIVGMQGSLALLGDNSCTNPLCKGRESWHLLGGAASLPIHGAAGRGKTGQAGIIPDLFSWGMADWDVPLDGSQKVFPSIRSKLDFHLEAEHAHKTALRARSDLPDFFTFFSPRLIFLGGWEWQTHIVLQCFLVGKTPTFCFSSVLVSLAPPAPQNFSFQSLNLNIQNVQLGMHQESIWMCGDFGTFCWCFVVHVVPASPNIAVGTTSHSWYFFFIWSWVVL